MKSAETLLRIQILGPVRASIGRAEIELGPPKQRAVLALLALRARDRVPLEDLFGALWGVQPPISAANLVHTYVARLRQTFEPDMPRRRRNNVISSVPGGYRLMLPEDRLDLRLFRRLSQQAGMLLDSREWERAFHLLGQAVREWQDPRLADLAALLPHLDEIDLVRQELVSTGLEYVTLGLEHGRASTVLPVAERLAQVDPLNETIQARCLQALSRTGQRAAAVARYADVRARLQVELGVDPSAELVAAYREVLDADAPAATDPIAVSTLPDRSPWRGPGPTIDELIGRRDDERHVLNLLNRHRLVTLTGPAGVGKTALALAVAEIGRDGFSGGVAVAELSAARSRSDVVRVLSAVLGLPHAPSDAQRDVLIDQLADQNMLLLLDNVELAIDETADLIDEVLRGCPGVSVLVTSRELLGMAYEAVHPVGPLAMTDPCADADLARLATVPAVHLFARRAAQVRPGFRLNETNVQLVASVCWQLDGLPLAIELAAACLRTGQLYGLLDRLKDPLHGIRPPRRGGPSHHRSLYAAVHRSVELLDPNEQRYFACLGAVKGEFCAQAAACVAGRGLVGEQWDVQVLLDSLVDKSILEVRDGKQGPRYRMLRTIRALAQEMLSRFGYPERQLSASPCTAGCQCSGESAFGPFLPLTI